MSSNNMFKGECSVLITTLLVGVLIRAEQMLPGYIQFSVKKFFQKIFILSNMVQIISRNYND